MDIIKTREYYESLEKSDLCQCESCRYFYKEIKRRYPAVSSYLEKIGVDIAKPLELWAVSLDECGKTDDGSNFLYPDAQYVVMGDTDGFSGCEVDGVMISVTGCHPETGIDTEHFVIELSSFKI